MKLPVSRYSVPTSKNLLTSHLLKSIKNTCIKETPKDAVKADIIKGEFLYAEKLVNGKPIECCGVMSSIADEINNNNIHVKNWQKKYKKSTSKMFKNIDWYLWRWHMGNIYQPKLKKTKIAKILDMYTRKKVLIMECNYHMLSQDTTAAGVTYKKGTKFRPTYMFIDCNIGSELKKRNLTKAILPITEFGTVIIFRDIAITYMAPLNVNNPSIPIVFPDMKVKYSNSMKLSKKMTKLIDIYLQKGMA